MGVAVLIQEVKVGLFEEACIWYLSQPLKAVRELEQLARSRGTAKREWGEITGFGPRPLRARCCWVDKAGSKC